MIVYVIGGAYLAFHPGIALESIRICCRPIAKAGGRPVLRAARGFIEPGFCYCGHKVGLANKGKEDKAAPPQLEPVSLAEGVFAALRDAFLLGYVEAWSGNRRA
jgi:hypothetical protein